MILKFNFSRVSENGLLENILHIIIHKILCNIQVQWVIKSSKKELFLYVKGDDKALEKFSDEFSKLLPISLFYRFLSVDVVDSMPTQKPLLKCDINIPFTHTMLIDFLDKSKKDYLNFSLREDVGRSLEICSNLTEDDIHEAIRYLKNGENIQISTREGVKVLGILNKDKKEFLQKYNYTIMPCDLSLVQKMVIANNNEIEALASLEKPTLNLRVNLIYKSKNTLPTSWVNIRMFDTLLLFLLCKKLFESGEEFIFLIDDKIPCNFSLLHEQKSITKQLFVNVLENGEITMIGDNEYISDKKFPTFKKKAHERFATILYEYNLFSKKNICFFLSKKYDDKIMFYTEKKGLSELIKVNIPNSINEIIQSIKEDENGKKLIQNYEKTYNNIFQKVIDMKIPKDSPRNFYTLLGVVGAFFGYGDDIESSAKKMLLYAKNFSGLKGPRIDVKLKDRGFIDVEKFIQSGLSFRLAGAEDEMLSFGYFESISFFISDICDDMKKEFDFDNVSLCGEMYEFKRFLEICAKNIQPNHKIYLNRAFSLE